MQMKEKYIFISVRVPSHQQEQGVRHPSTQTWYVQTLCVPSALADGINATSFFLTNLNCIFE